MKPKTEQHRSSRRTHPAHAAWAVRYDADQGSGRVIDASAANGVVIEINANPYRLDMDWSHIPYAMEKGVMISINPDSHSIPEIDNIRWGVSAARKGGLTKTMTWNAQLLTFVQGWLDKRRHSQV